MVPLLLLLTLLFSPGVAHAQDAEAKADAKPASMTWSVVPASADGPDGRSWLELDLDPGENQQEYVAIRNLGTFDATFRITAKDGYFTDTGRFNMLESAQESMGAGTWIHVPDQVAVPAGQTAVVPFTITVPENATPGDQAAGVAASIINTAASASGEQLQVESRMGFKLLMRVSGVLAPAVVVENLTADFDLSWNPFAPGAATVSYSVRNTGNARLSLAAVVTAGAGRTGPARVEAGNEMLPGEERQFTATVQGVWPLFLAQVGVEVSGAVPTASGSINNAGSIDARQGATADMAPVSASTAILAMPWPQLLVLAGGLLTAIGMTRGRSRRRLVVEELIAQARRDGELSARRDSNPASRT